MKELELNKVHSIKVTSGEEIIGKVIEQTDVTITLEQGITIGMGQQGMQLIPAMFTTLPTANLTINTANITMFADTSDDVIDAYREATTGIKTPDKKIIMG
jgi:hypothetical protein